MTGRIHSFESLAAVDGQLKTSSNQRLAVELALMKLSGMGQKKNFDLNDDLPLPELIREGQGVESQNNTTASAAPAPSAAPAAATPSVAAQTTAPRPAAQPAAASEQPQSQPQSVAQEAVVSVASVQAEKAATLTKASFGGSAFGGLGGSSIMSLLSNKGGAVEQDDIPEEVVDTRIDPDAEAKIKQAQAVFVEAMMAERQRIGVAFEDMTVSGNCVTITVGSDDLRQEILRSQYEILSLLAEIADVRGAIELDVSVTADKQRAEILIKPEDKVHYLCEQNPAWLELRSALDLDIE